MLLEQKDGAYRCANSSKETAKKPYKMYDREGLFLLVNPSGPKLWRWRYWADGKEKLMALGEYPIVNLAEARERHFASRKNVAAGSLTSPCGPSRPRGI